jgi:hypothetical protein
MTAEYVNFLTDVACQRIAAPLAAAPPPLHLSNMDPAAFIMSVLHHIGTTPLPLTRHGTDDMIEVMLLHPELRGTLAHAAHIQEHFATTFLSSTNAVFKDHWTYIIVPAWNQMAQAWAVSVGSGAGAGGAAGAAA